MAFASTAPRTFSFTALPRFNAKFSLWRILRDALAESRRRRAEYEVAHYLESIGGKFTDETEREIERRLMSSSNSSRW
mgnify:CR=1 FL=1|jgi:hypothetical protein